MNRMEQAHIVAAAERCEYALQIEAARLAAGDLDGAAQAAEWAGAESWLAFSVATAGRVGLGWGSA